MFNGTDYIQNAMQYDWSVYGDESIYIRYEIRSLFNMSLTSQQ